ncbi:DUF6369 family protein [Croceivirga sp. JEA036]|uniref:DUF6369 family protein n=1 Tax=Croceivirga sp. JEA036 TaxID=2721162 RepID=UPI00143BF148|nr:DUF6369 family protein [Croceivirga sp. JEA036]NJB37079.1 hypothetical protein [Croceivirga sp. JEA036]
MGLLFLFFLFSFLFFSFLVVGYNFWNRRDIYPFLKLMALLPLTSSLVALHTRFQINVYYAFILMPLFFFVEETIVNKKISKPLIMVTLSAAIFLGGYLLYGILFNSSDITAIDVLKDIKPIFFLTVGFVFLVLLKDHQLAWNGKLAYKILKYNFYASLFWFVLFKTTNIIGIVSNDPFYLRSEIRYASISTSFVLLYFVGSIASKKKFSKLELVFVLVPIFFTGNRTSFVVLALLFVVNMILSANNINLLIKRIFFFLMGFVFLVIGIFNFSKTLKERFLTLLDFNLLAEQLGDKRFSPFFQKLANFEWYHYIFGKGIGETIFIPWFAYRENIENNNIYMDNLFMTLFIKYGLFMIVPLVLLFFFVNKTNTNKRFKILIILYFIGMGLTTSFMYQTSFLFIVILLASFKFSEKSIASLSN